MNIKRVRRLYNLEGLQMRHTSPPRRVMTELRDDRGIAAGPNQVWAMQWVHDELFDGLRILTVVDTFSRVCPVMRVCRSATAIEVIDALDEARHNSGLPHTIRVDQGSQFTSKELDLWAYANNVTLDSSRSGKPTDNAYVESFNANVRLECLGRHWFLDLDDARTKVEDWRREYNEVRSHSAIGDRDANILDPSASDDLRGVKRAGDSYLNRSTIRDTLSGWKKPAGRSKVGVQFTNKEMLPVPP